MNHPIYESSADLLTAAIFVPGVARYGAQAPIERVALSHD